jgi:hypothetical protein
VDRYHYEPANATTPDRVFDRTWAVTLLGRVLELLGAEYAKSGQAEVFAQLKVILIEGNGAVPAATLVERLGTGENAVNVAIHGSGSAIARFSRTNRGHARRRGATQAAVPRKVCRSNA